MKTFITVQDGKVDRVMQKRDGVSPGADWTEIPDDWNGDHGDKFPAWFDASNRRIPDAALVNQGKRTDNRGLYYSKEKAGETKQIHSLDEEIGAGWTKEPPLEDEPYQKWDEQGKRWIIDTKKKETAEKETQIAEIQNQIVECESKLQRPLIALADPTLTAAEEAEERSYYAEYSNQIKVLRQQKLALLSS